MKTHYLKFLFITFIAVFFCVLLICSCDHKSTDITTMTQGEQTLSTTAGYHWDINISYPEHSECALREILSEKYDNFDDKKDYFVYLNYVNTAKTTYQIFYSYVYKTVLLESAYVVYVEDGYIKGINNIEAKNKEYHDSLFGFDAEYWGLDEKDPFFVNSFSEEAWISKSGLDGTKGEFNDVVSNVFKEMLEDCRKTNSHRDPLNQVRYFYGAPMCGETTCIYTIYYECYGYDKPTLRKNNTYYVVQD